MQVKVAIVGGDISCLDFPAGSTVGNVLLKNKGVDTSNLFLNGERCERSDPIKDQDVVTLTPKKKGLLDVFK